jgi:hypothetical protein
VNTWPEKYLAVTKAKDSGSGERKYFVVNNRTVVTTFPKSAGACSKGGK